MQSLSPGGACQQLLCVGVAGRSQDRSSSSAFHDLAGVKDGNAVADGRHGRQIVRDVEHRTSHLAVEGSEHLEDFRLRHCVQRAGGLIRD